MKIISQLESWNRSLVIVLGLILIAVIGVLDFMTGYEYAFSVFYVLPISMLTWGVGQKLGYLACCVSAIVWFIADVSTGHPYSSPYIPYWNSLIRLSFFVIITFLLSSLKVALQHEKELSLTDYLTGASNARYFYEIVQMEISRLERNPRPFTIVYIDLDNFKAINDEFGHTEGDRILQITVNAVRTRVRNADLVARLGGDEFALFFPDTNQETAHVVVNKLREGLLDDLKKCNYPVTCSMGVLTCSVSPYSLNDLIRVADNLMYSAKRSGKNSVHYAIYEFE